MKRIFTAALIALLVCVSASAVQIETGTAGQKVSSVNPLPVQAIGGITSSGTLDVAVEAPESGTSSVLLLSSTAQEITPTTNQRYLALFASGTFEWALGSTTAITNRPSVYNCVIPANVSVSVWTTATGTYLGFDKVGK